MSHGSWRAVSLVVLWLSMLPAMGDGATRELALEALPHGLWAVTVRVAGSARPWRFLLDTGSTHTLLSTDTARRAGLDVRPGRQVATPGGLSPAGESTLVGLDLGGRLLPPLRVLVVDLVAIGGSARVDGILGMDAIGESRLHLDLVGGRLSFPEASEPSRQRGGQPVPARIVDGRVLVDAHVGGRRRTLVLDSGAAGLVLYDDRDAGTSVRLGTAGGSTGARAGRAELAIGALRLGAVPALRLAAPPGRSGSDGLLPAALFVSIDIDRAAAEVRLVPRR